MKLFTMLLVVFFIVFSCYGQDNQSIYVGQEKITLRYSTENDIEELLGKPEKTEFFERGGEGFYWENFTACSYGEDKLIFHYAHDGSVIRISANTEYYGEVQFFRKNIKLLTREDIQGLLESFGGEDDYYNTRDFILYYYEITPEVEITYSFWFDAIGKIKWIDMFYTWPW